MKKALNALKESTISVGNDGPVETNTRITPHFQTNNQTMTTVEKLIKVNSNTVFPAGGMIAMVDWNTKTPMQSVKGESATSLSLALDFGHELGHRTNASGFVQDDRRQTDNDRNTELVKNACGFN